MGKRNTKQHNKSKNRNGKNHLSQKRASRNGTGLPENVRVTHGEENNPHDG